MRRAAEDTGVRVTIRGGPIDNGSYFAFGVRVAVR
jgi:hypothetical protein